MTRQRILGRLDRVVVRLVVITVLAGLVAAVVGGILVWTQARTAVHSQIATRTAAVAESVAVRLDTLVRGVAENLRTASTVPTIAAADPDAAPDLRAVLAASPVFDELALVDSSGHVVAAAATRFLADPSDYPLRSDLLEIPADGMHVAVLDEFPTELEVAVPIESPPGQVSGALVARLPLELLAVHISRPDPGTDAVAFLVGRDGRYLVHPSRDLVARGERLPAEWIPTAGVRQEMLESEGRRWIVAVAPTADVPGAVVIQSDEVAALAPARRQLIELGLTVVAVIAATVAAVALAGRQLLRPLNPLSEAVGRLERGEQGVRVATPASGEIGALTRQLNGMAAALDRRAEEVSQMHHLSLLVTSHADRHQVGRELVDGAKALLQAETAVVFAPDEQGRLRVEAVGGKPSTLVSLRQAAEECSRSGRAETAPTGDENGQSLTLPVKGMEGQVLGVIALVRRPGRFTDEEVRLAEAFSSFAGVALENVRRLEYEQALVAELEQAIELRRDLMGRVSHDLRVPIVCIEGFAAKLQNELGSLDDGQAEELVASISEQAEILDDLVTKLLEYSVPVRSRRPVSLAPVAVRPIVAAALDNVAPLLGERPIENEVEDFVVEADATLLVRVLSHLLSNAIRYSPAGSPVRLRARAERGTARIEVSDDGSGLTSEEVGRIFEPFWRRVAEGEEQTGNGLGLGLTLAAEYVKAMGGSLDVESEPGRGSTFSIELPIPQDETVPGSATANVR